MRIVALVALINALCWLALIAGFSFIRRKSDLSMKLERLIWNSRVDRFQKRPFNFIVELCETRRYLLLVISVIVLNLSMVLLMFALGIIMISPLIILVLGFSSGALLAQADKKTLLFAVGVMIFELGAFSSSAGIGFYLGVKWLLLKYPLAELSQEIFSGGSLLLPISCLIMNGFFEGIGIYLGIEGVPGIKAYKEKLYK